MQWISNDCHPEWGAPCLASFARHGFYAGLLIGVLCFALSVAAAETPQNLLSAGRIDQALQILEHQPAPTAESYNLICRAHFEVEAWDAAITACEKAVALAPDNSVYHLWLG